MPASARGIGIGYFSGQRQNTVRPPIRLRSYLLAYGLLSAFLILAHGPLLVLPYYWDEIGQFIPASLDLFRAGAWIPISTVPNVHPPGLMAYLTIFWSIFGYSVLATRIAMLLIAGALCLVTFLLAIELSRGTTGAPAFAAIALLCASPLFFAQSMLAQLDMPAACLSLLALLLFLQSRIRASAVTCAVLVLVKETGLIVPMLLGFWTVFERRGRRDMIEATWFLLPLPGLAIWLIALHRKTGYWLGNAQFTAYNVFEPLHTVTFLLAFSRRVWYLFVGSGHIIGVIVVIWAWRRMPLLRERPWKIAASFVLAQTIMVSALGGAVLERYLLPAVPVVYIAFATSLCALPAKIRQIALAALLVCLAAANFINPLYPFPFENNLAFANFVGLEQDAAQTVSMASLALPGGGRVAATFPIADALRNPDFGFVTRAQTVVTIDDFSAGEVERLKQQDPDLVVVYNRVWDPLHLLDRPLVRTFLIRHYGYMPELAADQVAAALSMRVMRGWKRGGLTMYVLKRDRIPHRLLTQ